MKYNYAIEMLKIFFNAISDPTSVTRNIRKRETLEYQRSLESNNTMNNSMDNNIYAEPENSNIEYNQSSNKEFNESVPREDSKSYNDNEGVTREDNKSYEDSNSYNNKSNGYYNEQQDTLSDPQGVMDSITQEMTSVRLQQAIILSEIVGKPRSKTRKKRRF